MMASVPVSAAPGPPETGASTKAPPRAAVAGRREAFGEARAHEAEPDEADGSWHLPSPSEPIDPDRVVVEQLPARLARTVGDCLREAGEDLGEGAGEAVDREIAREQ